MIVEFDRIFAQPRGDQLELENWKLIFSFQGTNLEKSESYLSGEWDGVHRLYEEGDLRVPVGLAVFYKSLLDETFESTIDYVNYPTKNLNWFKVDDVNPYCLVDPEKEFEFHGFQCKSIAVAVRNYGGVLYIGTGGGKTEIAGGIIAHLGMKTLFVTDSTGVALNQAYQRFIDRGFESVGRIGEGHLELDCDLTVAEVPTLHSQLRRGNSDLIQFLQSIELAIYDEVHHLAANTWTTVGLSCPAKVKIGLSGTPFLRYEDLQNNICGLNEITDDALRDLRIIGVVGGIALIIPSSWLVEKGYLAKPIITFVRSPRLEMRGLEHWRTVYERGIVNNHNRNQLIATIAYTMYCTNNRSRVVVQVDEWNHAANLMRLMAQMRLPCQTYGGGSSILDYDPDYSAPFRSTLYKLRKGKKPKECKVEEFLAIVERMEDRDFDEFRMLSEIHLKVMDSKPLSTSESNKLNRYGFKYNRVKAGYDALRPGKMTLQELIDKYSNLERYVMISSPVIDTSFDLKEIDTLIPAAGKKSPIKVIQRLGRGMRLQGGSNDLYVYDFVDGQHYYLKNHSRVRMKYFSDQGHQVSEISVTPRFNLFWEEGANMQELVKYYQKIFLEGSNGQG